MSKYIFKKVKDPDNHFDKSDITFEVEAESLDDICEELTYFIRACSFAGDRVITHCKRVITHCKEGEDEV